MNKIRYGLTERWLEQLIVQAEQKVGGVERVQGIRRKEKTIHRSREASYRYGEIRKRWEQQYGVYIKQPIRGRALGTKRGRTLRERRNGVDQGKTWEKRERGRRRIQNSRTVRDIDMVKRRERQHKRIWNEQRKRRKCRGDSEEKTHSVIEFEKTVLTEHVNVWGLKHEESLMVEEGEVCEERNSQPSKEVYDDSEYWVQSVKVDFKQMETIAEIELKKDWYLHEDEFEHEVLKDRYVGMLGTYGFEGVEEKGRYENDIRHRVIGKELFELNKLLMQRNVRRGRCFGPEGRRQEFKEKGGERVRRREK